MIAKLSIPPFGIDVGKSGVLVRFWRPGGIQAAFASAGFPPIGGIHAVTRPSLQHFSPAGQNALPCIRNLRFGFWSPAMPHPRVNGIPARNLPRAERYE